MKVQASKWFSGHLWNWFKLKERKWKISAHADGGPRSRVCAHETLQILIFFPGFLLHAKILLAQMGVLAPGSAHARPSARPPIDTSGNFPAHVSAESLFLNFTIFRSHVFRVTFNIFPNP